MAEHQSVGRRTVLRTLGTVAAVATGASTASTATERQRSPPGETDAEVGTNLTGLYSGTVDRIVDGEHVVILVESGESVLDQHVVPTEEYPSLAAGDSVYLFVLFGTVLAIWEASGE